MSERYFYTKHYPNRWTSGPEIGRFNSNMVPIKSLEEARKLAEKYAVGGYGENRCVTTYGIEYINE